MATPEEKEPGPCTFPTTRTIAPNEDTSNNNNNKNDSSVDTNSVDNNSVDNNNDNSTASSSKHHQHHHVKENKRLVLKRLGLLLLFLLIFPLIPLTLAVLFGALLAWAEQVSFLEGFLYVVSTLLNMSTPLTDFNPSDALGVTIDVYVTIISILCFGIVLNIVNVFQVPRTINRMVEFVVKGKVIVPVIAIGLVIPFLFALIAVVFGSILGVMEGWDIHDGILYVFGNLLGLANPFVEVVPDTISGDILDIFISSIALGFVSIFFDYVTSLNPARYIRKFFKGLLERQGLVDLNGPNAIPAHYPLDNYSMTRDDDNDDQMIMSCENSC